MGGKGKGVRCPAGVLSAVPFFFSFTFFLFLFFSFLVGRNAGGCVCWDGTPQAKQTAICYTLYTFSFLFLSDEKIFVERTADLGVRDTQESRLKSQSTRYISPHPPDCTRSIRPFLLPHPKPRKYATLPCPILSYLIPFVFNRLFVIFLTSHSSIFRFSFSRSSAPARYENTYHTVHTIQ